MLLEVRPSRSRIAAPITWASVAGIAGSAANVFLVAFFVLALGLGLPQHGWLGTANDALILVAFLALVPVAMALRERLALPIWWLLLARLVFPRARRTSVPERGEPS